MDISSVSLTKMNQYTAGLQRQEAEINSFQSLLAQAEGQEEKTKQEIKAACESLESYFIQMMFREMRKTSFDENGFIAKSNAEKMFIDLMDEETAKTAAKSGGIGLADMMYKQITQYNTGTAR